MVKTKQNIERIRFAHRVQGVMIAFVLFCAYVFVPSDAYADCVNPAGVRGQQVYNGTHDVMQFCNGTDWIAMRGGSYDPLTSLSCADNEIALWHAGDSEWKCGLDSGADDMGNHTATQNVDAASNNVLNVNFLELEKVAGAAMPGVHGGGTFGGNGCSLSGGSSIPHGVSGTVYQAATVPFGNTCQSETRMCNNGTLMSGTYEYGSCEVAAGGLCAIPWGGTLAHAADVTAYQAANVPHGSSCVSETRNCNNGTLSGSYTHESCVVNPPADCNLPWGGTITDGASVTAYASSGSADCAGNSQTRTCSNGTLSGSFVYQSCAALQAVNVSAVIGVYASNGSFSGGGSGSVSVAGYYSNSGSGAAGVNIYSGNSTGCSGGQTTDCSSYTALYDTTTIYAASGTVLSLSVSASGNTGMGWNPSVQSLLSINSGGSSLNCQARAGYPGSYTQYVNPPGESFNDSDTCSFTVP